GGDHQLACGSTRDIERGEGAAQGTHEAVKRGVRVQVESRDRARRVDALGYGPGAGAWGVERGEGAVGRLQEAVLDEIRVSIASRDGARGVDARGKGETDGQGVGARGVVSRARAGGVPREAVKAAARYTRS